jgi:hypothetical protein
MAGVLGVAASLGPGAPVADADTDAILVRMVASDRTDSLEFQRALVAGLMALILGPPNPVAAKDLVSSGYWQMETQGGAPAVITKRRPVETEGLGVLIGIAIIIIVVGAVAGALLYDAHQAEVAVRKIEGDSKQQQLKTLLAKATEMVDKHHERERKEGRTIPWDAGELKMLDMLQTGIHDVTGWTPSPLSTTPNLKKFSEDAGEGVKKIGEGIGTGVSWGLPAALALGTALFVLTD